MIIRILFLALLALCQSGASADEHRCKGVSSERDRFGDLKSLLLFGAYDSFFSEIDRAAGVEQGSSDELQLAVKRAYPAGFAHCETLVLIQQEPSMHLELILLRDADGKGLFVGWHSYSFEGNLFIPKYWISTDYDTVSEFWR